jgi:choline dehydrogenase-like flavoprotein
MSHFSYRPRGENLELEADYVVVGSGAGGASVAVGLARGGASVAIVEAGAWRDPEHLPHSMFGVMRDTMDNFGATVTRGRALWPVVQGRAVGGTTVINSAIIVRTPGDVFRLWQEEQGFGGDALAKEVWRIQDTLDRELHVGTIPAIHWGRNNELAKKGAQALDLHEHDMKRSVKDCVGSSGCLQGCKRGAKQSTNLNFVPETLACGGHVLSCAPVEKVLFDGRRAVGVKGVFRHPLTRKKGAAFSVRATKAVVVAASATHTPALLMRSGVKSRMLGYFFCAHPGTGVFGVYDDKVNMDYGATQGWSSMKLRDSMRIKMETLALPLELLCSRLAGAGQQLMERILDVPNMAFWVMAIRARTMGRVKVGWDGQPVVHYSMTKEDMKTARAAMHVLGKIHVAAGAKKLIPAVHGLPYSLRPDEVDKILEAPLDPRAWVLILSHLFGGCVMGVDPNRSVCDPHGRVHGYEGLVVADASAIPTTIGVNPQHTIMALARLRSEELLAAG